jgi:hypothetical protein
VSGTSFLGNKIIICDTWFRTRENSVKKHHLVASMLMFCTFSIRHSHIDLELERIAPSSLKLSINYSFVNYKHHNLLSFCWPMFNMIMLCQLSPGLEFLVTKIAFEFLPIERIEFHYFYYDTCCI